MSNAQRVHLLREHPVLAFAESEFARHRSWAEQEALPACPHIVIIGTWDDVQARHPDVWGQRAMPEPHFSDDFLIRETQELLILSGRSERATLYAVYQYAADRWGMHWIYPGEDRPTLSFRDPAGRAGRDASDPNEYALHSTGFERRGFVFETVDDPVYMKAMIDWLAKNKINEVFFTFSLWDRLKGVLADEMRRRGLQITLGGHSMKFFMPGGGEAPKEEQADHPYTAKRQLNYRDSDWQDELLDKVAAYCRNVPGLTRVSLWPEDVADRSGESFLPGYLRFTEKLRERLRAAGLHAEVEHIAYNAGLSWQMLERGEIELSPQLDTLFAYWGRDYSRRLDAGVHRSDERARQALEDWVVALREAGQRLTVFEYYSDHFMLSPMFPTLAQRIVEDISYYRSLGVGGIVNLVVPCNGLPLYPWQWVHGFNSYVYCQALWGQSAEGLLHSYYSYYPAEEREAIRALFEAIEANVATLTGWNVPLFPARAVDPEKAQASAETAESIIAMLKEIQSKLLGVLDGASMDRQGGPYRYAQHLIRLSAELENDWRAVRSR